MRPREVRLRLATSIYPAGAIEEARLHVVGQCSVRQRARKTATEVILQPNEEVPATIILEFLNAALRAATRPYLTSSLK
jgi:hypothetical protein